MSYLKNKSLNPLSKIFRVFFDKIFILVLIHISTVPASAQVVLAINAGGGAYTASDGTHYQADNYTTGTGLMYVNTAIKNTDDDALYQTERWSIENLSYEIPLQNGEYQVTLQFAEIYYSYNDTRIFSVFAENETFIRNLDIVEQTAGKGIAFQKTRDVSVLDGVLNLYLSSTKNNPKISAILIEQKRSVASMVSVAK